MGSIIIIFFGGAWILQLGLSYLQMKRFYKKVRRLRKGGCLGAIGKEGSMYKRKLYTVLVVDENDRVVHAEQLNGWTVFASLRPVPEVVGVTLADLMDDTKTLRISRKLLLSFRSAVKAIEQEKQKKSQQRNNDPLTVAEVTTLTHYAPTGGSNHPKTSAG
jgi:DNA-binding transcriptional regulator of glucitol operon